MGKQISLEKFGAFGFTVLLGSSLFWMEPGGTAHAATISRTPRVQHARELLGKYYDRSIVKTSERVLDVRQFVRKSAERGLPGKNRKQAAKVARTILQEAARYGFDPIFLMAVIENESSFNPAIVGSFGEIGLMQIKPATAGWIAKKVQIRYTGVSTLLDPVMNIKIGAAYMNFLRERFNAHSRLYIAAYNMGARNVDKSLNKRVWPREYASAVMTRYVRFYTELNQNRILAAAGRPH